jgi:hypothetical protein
MNKRVTRAKGEAPVGLRVGVTRSTAEARVDRETGAGVIRGYSVITRGEALGHGMWIDMEMLGQVAAAGNAKRGGVKSRYTHPGASSDGLGTLLGQTTNFRAAGNRVVGDLAFVASAHKTPDGDLASYVMDLAEETPELFGASIVFARDRKAEEEFAVANGAKRKEDRWGPYLDFKEFKSPDPDNRNNLPHARLAVLRASDVVDEPAANPGGMFSALAGNELPEAAEAALDYALGLSEAAPESAVLGVHPERMRLFVGGYLERRGLSVVQAEGREELNRQDAKDATDAKEEEEKNLNRGDAENAECSRKEAKIGQDAEKNMKGGVTAMTKEQLQKDHPELYAAVYGEGKAAGEAGVAEKLTAATATERKRCGAIAKEAARLKQGDKAGELILSDKDETAALMGLKDAAIEALTAAGAPAVGAAAEEKKPETKAGAMDAALLAAVAKK